MCMEPCLGLGELFHQNQKKSENANFIVTKLPVVRAKMTATYLIHLRTVLYKNSAECYNIIAPALCLHIKTQ